MEMNLEGMSPYWTLNLSCAIYLLPGESLCPSGSPFIVKKCSNDEACTSGSEYCHLGTCCPKDHPNTGIMNPKSFYYISNGSKLLQ